MKDYIAGFIASVLVIVAFLVSVVAHIGVGVVVVLIFNSLLGADLGTVAMGIVALVSWLKSKGDSVWSM